MAGTTTRSLRQSTLPCKAKAVCVNILFIDTPNNIRICGNCRKRCLMMMQLRWAFVWVGETTAVNFMTTSVDNHFQACTRSTKRKPLNLNTLHLHILFASVRETILLQHMLHALSCINRLRMSEFARTHSTHTRGPQRAQKGPVNSLGRQVEVRTEVRPIHSPTEMTGPLGALCAPAQPLRITCNLRDGCY